MYEFQKYSVSAAPSAPPPFSQPSPASSAPPPFSQPSPASSAPPPFSQPSQANVFLVNSTNQYYPGNSQTIIKTPWSSGLCDCFSDVSSCCLTCWCPCITFGRISEIVDKGSFSCVANGVIYTLLACLTGCACLYSCCYRSKMRQQYMLEEIPCGDCLVHCCCETCALCQEYRELKIRGFDMPIGWHRNMAIQNGGVAMAPVVQVGMIR